MIDVRRDNRPPPGNFLPDKLWRDVFRNAGAEGFAWMLEANIRAVIVCRLICVLASKILANGDELHFRRDDPSARVCQLRHGRALSRFTRSAPEPWKGFQPHTALTLRGMRETEKTVVFGA